MRYLILLAVLTASCGSASPDSADASDPSTTPATLADLQALTDKIAALEKRLAAVEKATGTDGADGTDGSDGAPGAMPTYWLYDGNGVKKWKVGSTPDKWNMVEVEPGIWQHYSTEDYYSSDPANLSDVALMRYSGAGCTGTAYLTSTRFNTIYTWAGWRMKVDGTTPIHRNVATQSFKLPATGQCGSQVYTLPSGFAVENTSQASPVLAIPPFEIRPE